MPLYKSELSQPFSLTKSRKQLARPPVVEQTVHFFEPLRAQPWKPIQGYENIQEKPLISIYNRDVLSHLTSKPEGMTTEPLKFPNLVTGYDRNSGQVAKVAFDARYTHEDWKQGMIRLLNSADLCNNNAEKLEAEILKSLRQTDEKTARGQLESGRRLGERITDIGYWRDEVKNELERLIIEIDTLYEQQKAIQKCVDDIEGALHIVQECLFHREKREGIEKVHDNVEETLLNEVQLYRNQQEKLKKLTNKVQTQMRDSRAAQSDLEIDMGSKDSALAIDNMCHKLNNFSRGIKYYGGIEDHDITVNNTVTWAENSCKAVQRGQTERRKSAQLRSKILNIVNTCASEVWSAWKGSNAALERRMAETMEHKAKLYDKLQKCKDELFHLEKYCEILKKSIADKTPALQVAHTRLEARMHRKNIELCRDKAQDRLVYEVKDIQDSIETLDRNLQQVEAHQQLLIKTRSSLEEELYNKVYALFIDCEKVMTLRRSFPINAFLKYY